MPTVRQIEEALYSLAPKELAMGWDNVGLLVGDPNQEVTRILVSLDITQAVADEAAVKGAQLIIAHHPVMNCKWLPVQTLREDTRQGKLLRTLVKHEIAAICMHTNLDITQGGVNDVLAETLRLSALQILGEDNLIRYGFLEREISLKEFAAQVNKLLHCRGLRYTDCGKPAYRVAVGGGSCGDSWREILAAGCDTFVTSDVKYHDFLDASAEGLSIIDAGHFETEDPVCMAVIQYLQGRFPALHFEKSSHQGVIHYYTEGE